MLGVSFGRWGVGRIDAMRLLKVVPQMEARVESGEIKLSQLAQVQAFLRAEKKDAGKVYTPPQTVDLLSSLAGRSTRDTERLLLEKSPALQARRETAESVRPVTAQLTEIKIVADEELMALFEEARGLFAHGADMNPSAASLFKKGLQLLVERRKKQKGGPALLEQTMGYSPSAPKVSSPSVNAVPQLMHSPPTSRYIPASLRRLIFRRAQGRCEFTAPQGQRCTACHALELHHCDPYARGGEHRDSNLALYCRAHNAAQGSLDFPLRSA